MADGGHPIRVSVGVHSLPAPPAAAMLCQEALGAKDNPHWRSNALRERPRPAGREGIGRFPAGRFANDRNVSTLIQ